MHSTTWRNNEIIMLGIKSQTKCCMIAFTENTRKGKVIYSDRKQMVA